MHVRTVVKVHVETHVMIHVEIQQLETVGALIVLEAVHQLARERALHRVKKVVPRLVRPDAEEIVAVHVRQVVPVSVRVVAREVVLADANQVANAPVRIVVRMDVVLLAKAVLEVVKDNVTDNAPVRVRQPVLGHARMVVMIGAIIIVRVT